MIKEIKSKKPLDKALFANVFNDFAGKKLLNLLNFQTIVQPHYIDETGVIEEGHDLVIRIDNHKLVPFDEAKQAFVAMWIKDISKIDSTVENAEKMVGELVKKLKII